MVSMWRCNISRPEHTQIIAGDLLFPCQHLLHSSLGSNASMICSRHPKRALAVHAMPSHNSILRSINPCHHGFSACQSGRFAARRRARKAIDHDICRISLHYITGHNVQLTSTARVSAWPMCREPVTFGGGMTMLNVSVALSSGLKQPDSSHQAYLSNAQDFDQELLVEPKSREIPTSRPGTCMPSSANSNELL